MNDFCPYGFVGITKNRGMIRTTCKTSVMMFERVLNTSFKNMFFHMWSVSSWCHKFFIFRICKYLNPASIYLFKANSENIRKMREIFSKLTIKTPKPCHTLFWVFHCWLWISKYRLETEMWCDDVSHLTY